MTNTPNKPTFDSPAASKHAITTQPRKTTPAVNFLEHCIVALLFISFGVFFAYLVMTPEHLVKRDMSVVNETIREAVKR